MKTVLLLICSNVFMTFAWYGHLKYRKAPLFAAIVASWLIAFFEYCFQVPANRIGYGEFTAFGMTIPFAACPAEPVAGRRSFIAEFFSVHS